MAEDWAVDVKKYVPGADDNVIAGIVRYCGIALRNRDSSLVSFTDTKETDRVRENFLKKKLGLTDPDSVLDAAIAQVGERMKADTTKNRVTVYYLLAEAFGRLHMFIKGGSPEVEPEPVVAAPVAAMAAPLAAAAVPVARKSRAPLAILALGLATFVGIGALIGFGSKKPTVAVAAAPAAVAAPAVVEIPTGAGIVNEVVDGRPKVSIYFDTAKADIYPNFEARTEDLRKWLADNPGHHLEVSGYNDPRGNAEFNAQLSKARAFAVRDGLVKLGVLITAIDMVKPADTTDTTDSLAQARRVDVTIEDGPVPAGEAATQPTPAQP